MRDEILKVADAVTVPMISETQRMDQRVLAAETYPGKMGFPTCLSALRPADNDRSDVQEITQRKFERRNQNSRTCLTDDGSIGVNIERREAIGDRPVFRWGTHGVYRVKFCAGHQCAGTERVENLPAGPGSRVRRRPQDQLGSSISRIIEQHLRRDLAEGDWARGACAYRDERRLRHA